MKVVGANTFESPGIRRVTLTYELHSPHDWLLASVVTLDSAGAWTVEGVNATPLVMPLEESTRFSLANKSAVHYLWLAIAALCLSASLGTAVFLATRRTMPKRWRRKYRDWRRRADASSLAPGLASESVA